MQGSGPCPPPQLCREVGQHQRGVLDPHPARKGLISPSTALPPHHGTGMLFPMGVMGKLRQLKGKRAPGHWEGEKPTVSEGLRAGGRTPTPRGAQHGGPLSLSPNPSFPSWGAQPHTGREGRQLLPPPNAPHGPEPTTDPAGGTGNHLCWLNWATSKSPHSQHGLGEDPDLLTPKPHPICSLQHPAGVEWGG